MHRDIKPNNILVDPENGMIKLADFGLSRRFTYPLKTYTKGIVTLVYRAPELLMDSGDYSPSIDMWSVGCIFYYLTHGRLPFFG